MTPLAAVRGCLLKNFKSLMATVQAHKSELAWFALLSGDDQLRSALKEFRWTKKFRAAADGLPGVSDEMDQARVLLLQSVQASWQFVTKEITGERPPPDFSLFHEAAAAREQGAKQTVVLTRDFADAAERLDLEFAAARDRAQWTLFRARLRDQMGDPERFAPAAFVRDPFCLPFEPPRLLAPSPFGAAAGDVFDAVAHCEVSHGATPFAMLLFLRLFGLFKSARIAQCSLIRFGPPIRCVLFAGADDITLLTYSEWGANGELALLPYDDREFAESVMLGQWGAASLFLSHIVIRIVPADVLYARRCDAGRIAVWTISAGHFVIAVDREAPPALRSADLPPCPFLHRWADGAASGRWPTPPLAADDVLLVVNGLRGRAFADPLRPPLFPRPAGCSQVFATEADGDDSVPADLYYYPPMANAADAESWRAALEADAPGLRRFLRSRLAVERGREPPGFRGRIDGPIPHLPARLAVTGSGRLLFAPGILWAPRLSAHLCGPFIVTVDSHVLAAVALPQHRPLAQLANNAFAFTDFVTATANGLFVVLDFEGSASSSYQVLFSGGEPSRLAPAGDFPFPVAGRSAASGVHGQIGRAHV
jgi:hypothetical protein